jgi:uncharacterized YceG family protein
MTRNDGEAGRSHALIIATDRYTDQSFGELRAPSRDAEGLAGVLEDPAIGSFSVRAIVNEPGELVREEIEGFFADRRLDDLLVLYFSCHGVKDEAGRLYFAAMTTKLRRLAASGISSDFVYEQVERCRARKILLLLDCCYSGAYLKGHRPRAADRANIRALDGTGRAVITSSTALEYAFEMDTGEITGTAAPSIFTAVLVEGLRSGNADRDGDGLVSIDDLYGYVYDRVRETTPHQTPEKKWGDLRGDFIIAKNPHALRPQREALPAKLSEALQSPFSSDREIAIRELAALAFGTRAGLALTAREKLQSLASDDSIQVSTAAMAALFEPAAQPEDISQAKADLTAPDSQPTSDEKKRQATAVRPGNTAEPYPASPDSKGARRRQFIKEPHATIKVATSARLRNRLWDRARAISRNRHDITSNLAAQPPTREIPLGRQPGSRSADDQASDHETEIRQLRQRVAEMEAEAATHTRELERLEAQVRNSTWRPAEDQERLFVAMKQAELRLDATTAAHAAAQGQLRNAARTARQQQSISPAVSKISSPRPKKQKRTIHHNSGRSGAWLSTIAALSGKSAASPFSRPLNGRSLASTTSNSKTRQHRWRISIPTIAVAISLLCGLGIAAYEVHFRARPYDYPGPGIGQVIVRVLPHETATSLAAQLVHLGVVYSTNSFVSATKDNIKLSGIPPGYYRLRKHMNSQLAYALLLRSASRIQTVITIPEGLRATQILATLKQKTHTPASAFTAALKDTAALGLPSYANGNPEGYLFPATYTFNPGTSALTMLKAMVARYNQEAASINLTAAAKAGQLTPSQVITVASILEAEAGNPEYYADVAEVIYNRLDQGMFLELDSTVNYALHRFGISLTTTQLHVNSPYNTFIHLGLPPGPIDSPGNAAIEAALHPAHGDLLYFVTVNVKTGLTKFATTTAGFQQLENECNHNNSC